MLLCLLVIVFAFCFALRRGFHLKSAPVSAAPSGVAGAETVSVGRRMLGLRSALERPSWLYGCGHGSDTISDAVNVTHAGQYRCTTLQAILAEVVTKPKHLEIAIARRSGALAEYLG